MCPRETLNNFRNSTFADLKFGRQRPIAFASCVSDAYFTDPVGSKNGRMVRSPSTLSSALDHVSHVVGGRTQNQVLRLHVQRDVRPMANKQSVRNWAVEQHVSDAMRRKRLLVHFQTAVSLVCDTTPPQPNTAVGRRGFGHVALKVFSHLRGSDMLHTKRVSPGGAY